MNLTSLNYWLMIKNENAKKPRRPKHKKVISKCNIYVDSFSRGLNSTRLRFIG